MEYKAENTIGLRVEVLRNGGVYTTLEPYSAPEIRNASSSALKMSMSGAFLSVDTNKLPEITEEVSHTAGVDAPGADAEYGFAWDSAIKMFKSNNGGVASSAAVTKVTVNVETDCILTLSILSYGEPKYDYGVIYKLNSTPVMSNSIGENVLFSGKELINGATEEVQIVIPAGEHFFYVKYRKNGSQDYVGDYFAFTFKSWEPVNRQKREINWMTDRIRPILIINGTEYPCGVFIATTPERRIKAGREILDMEAYSVLYLAERVKIEGVYTIPAGTNYIAAVQELLQICGIKNYIAEQTDLTLSTDRADWKSGTSILEVINQLLAEINYRSAWVDLSGAVRITKYTAPSADRIRHTYAKGEYSIISDDATETTDYFDKANVFRAVCSSPDQDKPLVASAENNDPYSPYSTVSLGVRVLREEYVDSVPDLATLQERVENMLTKSLQTTEKIEFRTALCPTHETWDTVALEIGEVTGIYTETEWSMVLDAYGEMYHTAERVVFA